MKGVVGKLACSILKSAEIAKDSSLASQFGQTKRRILVNPDSTLFTMQKKRQPANFMLFTIFLWLKAFEIFGRDTHVCIRTGNVGITTANVHKVFDIDDRIYLRKIETWYWIVSSALLCVYVYSIQVLVRLMPCLFLKQLTNSVAMQLQWKRRCSTSM